ncbi:hypothetical protein DL765_009636 [Monosporascus sp. GIB2]|nr:hypothetical protein DL765_009636 [Monosporascus sp. GIB2]
MSGAEVISLISGIIGILDATVQVYSAITDASGLPGAFRDVAQRLPLVKETLRTASGRLNTNSPDERFYKTMRPIVDGCKDKAIRLEEIFRKVIPQADAPRMERYFLAVRTLGKGSRVEMLMKGILEDVQLLAGNHVMKLATKSELGKLVEATKEVSAISPSLPAGTLDPGINNFGSGPQNVNTGNGTQNNNNGLGQQFIGGTFFGALCFSQVV